MTIDKNYFPGWRRKAITFTNDDGNIPLDKKFIDIVKPRGFKGTFNLGLPRANVSAEEYREIYRGFGIANHCALHPFVLKDEERALICDEPFSEQADGAKIYKTSEPGLYRKKTPSGWWSHSATEERYIELVERAQKALEEIFGEGCVKSFVWPYCEQGSDKVKAYLKGRFLSVRKTGTLKDSTGFSMPKDRFAWSYNSVHTCLLEVGRLFETVADDGELKLLAFGLHSHDYENGKCWHVLDEFAREFGGRDEFYYSDVDDIFEYEDAINALEITEERLVNPSTKDLYIKINGEPVIICAGCSKNLK
jgi:hypothetical protein